MTRRSLTSLLLGLMLLLGAGCGDDGEAFGLEDAAAGPADYSYVIPAGAGQAFDRGEPLEILPADLTVETGEVIEIVNEDDRGHTVGPFYVGPQETLRQRFSTAGEFIGICTVHPSGEIVLTVE